MCLFVQHSHFFLFIGYIFNENILDSSIDALDIAGTVQLDVNSTVFKQRLNSKGKTISEAEAGMLRNKHKINHTCTSNNQ